MNKLDGSARRTSSLFSKLWPVGIFKDWPFSLYFVTASESDEGLVILLQKGFPHFTDNNNYSYNKFVLFTFYSICQLLRIHPYHLSSNLLHVLAQNIHHHENEINQNNILVNKIYLLCYQEITGTISQN